MVQVALSAQKRDLSIKAKDYRKDRQLPGVVYGHGFESVSVVMPYELVRKAYLKAGETTIVDLEIDGDVVSVLFKELQFHPVTDQIRHVDFYKVNLKEAITAMVPIEFVGEAPAVRGLGGTLTPQMTEIEVKCLPNKIPSYFEVDISVLADFHMAIHISDLVIPNDVELLEDAESTIVTVSAPRAEEEVADEGLTPEEIEAAAIAAGEPEDEKKDGDGEK
ncbi:50S ribosomal protein L25 [Candidatus Peregrinibacteria bacterium CG11_big_fil_rev_8_21_14_0_20_41_10]|nr:MAG: 50S ribosomal protein L25 [Candidatus Peregrinibacteria bacterium CG11_big_fil_rev_8_21_14_0_20_41_10]PIZ77359.1 MAG: 50S ribosomal protein L25 [Candidatus Peregrinibacteria bacterium CG_4_10_14_0_2_um_filter_41_8]PJC37869.1 MAG: 50S ribosomal protein L25 [Candidatus Peregrinibacteria bacterium CG_4_9_14_0_2_um_filter_41_14]